MQGSSIGDGKGDTRSLGDGSGNRKSMSENELGFWIEIDGTLPQTNMEIHIAPI